MSMHRLFAFLLVAFLGLAASLDAAQDFNGLGLKGLNAFMSSPLGNVPAVSIEADKDLRPILAAEFSKHYSLTSQAPVVIHAGLHKKYEPVWKWLIFRPGMRDVLTLEAISKGRNWSAQLQGSLLPDQRTKAVVSYWARVGLVVLISSYFCLVMLYVWGHAWTGRILWLGVIGWQVFDFFRFGFGIF